MKSRMIIGLILVSAISYAQNNFPSVDLEPILQKVQQRKTYKSMHAQEAWIITLYGITLPYDLVTLKQALLDSQLRKTFYQVDPKTYWLMSLIPHPPTNLDEKSDPFLTEISKKDISGCTPENCQIKLTPQEIQTLSKQINKLEGYHELIKNRMSLFLKTRKFVGYDRTDNTPIYQSMLKSFSLPQTPSFWNQVVSHGNLFYEQVDFLRGGIGKPLFKIYWQSTIEHQGIFYILTFDVYNNHFFDSGFSAFMLKALNPNQTLVVSVFNYEVDEMKKGFFIQLVFKEKFFEYQLLIQSSVIKKLQYWLSQSHSTTP